ncbi:MAG: helix-turn-helix domain-containing protein [Pseudodesulfovibrio sp.]|uniref:helix-turn-helix domain-containing protein n=1 Tax=Pseudodesulfovibrio sp. TaxID=2035812 RepID=UPI003D0DC136
MTEDSVVDLAPVKTPEQLLKEEIGLYLKIVRETQGKPLRWVAQKLGCSSSFISQIEKGDASIPLDRVLDFSLAYDLPVPEFVRIVFVTMHNDTYRALMSILENDPEMANAANRCHTVADPKERAKRRKALNPGLSSKSLQRMREFILENQKPTYGKSVAGDS